MLMLGLPLLLLWSGGQQFLLPGLWILSLYCLFIHQGSDGLSLRDSWNRAIVTRAQVKKIVVPFLPCAALLAALTYFLVPQNFLGFVRTNPGFWAIIMVAYPLLSVIPQEIIYRWFFFERYRRIFLTDRALIMASALAFGLGHIVFHNWVAPLLSTVGGLMFAATYIRCRSLALVSLEHAIYGDFIFTIGLGWYFYHGAHH